MATALPASRPSWFRIVALIAILWNVFGVVMYLSTVGVFGDPTAGLSAEDRALAESIPGWVKGAFAIGTFSGLIGSIGLLLARSWGQTLLLTSLVFLLLLEGWIVFVSGAVETHGIAVPVAVTVGAIFLAWLSTHAQRRGWLR